MSIVRPIPRHFASAVAAPALVSVRSACASQGARSLGIDYDEYGEPVQLDRGPVG